MSEKVKMPKYLQLMKKKKKKYIYIYIFFFCKMIFQIATFSKDKTYDLSHSAWIDFKFDVRSYTKGQRVELHCLFEIQV